jgi:hypothetical protein
MGALPPRSLPPLRARDHGFRGRGTIFLSPGMLPKRARDHGFSSLGASFCVAGDTPATGFAAVLLLSAEPPRAG